MGFAFVTSITPGPSNLILLAASANFGFRRTLPLVLGLSLSFLSMLLIVGFGLGQLLRANETIYAALKILSLFYILWLAWKIGRSSPMMPDGGEAPSRPITFLQMALLQWVNPKAWAVALTVTVAFTTPVNYAASLLLMTLVFGIVNLPSVSVWAVFGSMLRNLLGDPVKVHAFNLLMAVMLVASMLPIVFNFAP
jgi:threonine/homoserine/homoserine lactone efflux protein